MNYVLPVLVATLAITLVPAAVAQSVAEPTNAEISKVFDSIYGLRPSYAKCVDKTNEAGADTMQCMDVELAFQDRRLNLAYRSLSDKLDSNLKGKLKAFERTWMEYRDGSCAAMFDGKGRPPMDELSCRLYETAKQADSLEARLFLHQ
jgi:uncharacterized protein YecT (DUF1311 family)